MNIKPCPFCGAQADEIRTCIETALDCLEKGASNKQYDPSWIRPRVLSRREVNESCEQAYGHIHKALEIIAGKNEYQTQVRP